MADLPLHHFHDRLMSRRISPRQPQDMQRVANRRERIAKLMRQRRQKLIFAAVGFTEGMLGLLSLGHILHDGDDRLRNAILIANQRRAGMR